MSALPNVSAPACASRIGAVGERHVRLARQLERLRHRRRRRRRAGAPRSRPSASSRSSCGTSPAPRRRGPARPVGSTWAIVMPARTSIVWKTVAPTVVTGAMRPISVTGTISTGTPASTQSIRFWQESSLYRKLPVAVIVKMLIGRAMRSARSARKSCIISTIRGTPCSVNAPDTTGFFEFVSVMYRRHASETCGLDVGVRREGRREVGDVLEPVAEPDVLDEVGRVRQARPRRSGGRATLRPDEPGTKWTRSPPRSACGLPSRSKSVKAFGAVGDGRARRRRAGRGPARPSASRGRPWSSSRWRIPDPRISMPTSARTRFASSRIRPMRSSSRTVSVGRIDPPLRRVGRRRGTAA